MAVQKKDYAAEIAKLRKEHSKNAIVIGNTDGTVSAWNTDDDVAICDADGNPVSRSNAGRMRDWLAVNGFVAS